MCGTLLAQPSHGEKYGEFVSSGAKARVDDWVRDERFGGGDDGL